MAKRYKNKKKISKKYKSKRANKKLLTILGFSTALLFMVMGLLWFFVVFRSADRNASAGDELIAQGKFNEARKQYGRAINKEPQNLAYIAKLQDAILKIEPVTPDEARAFYDEYVSTLMHSARYDPTNIDAQLPIVYEMYDAAYATSAEEYWRRLNNAAQVGLDRISIDDSRHYELLLYRGMSSLHIEDASVTVTYDDEGNAKFPGEVDIEAVLQQDPGNALAWATLAHGRMAIYYRMKNEGRTQQAERNKIFADQTMSQALAVAGDSFEVNVTYLREMLLRENLLRQQYVLDPEEVTQSQLELAHKEVESVRGALINAFDAQLHASRISELITLLMSTGLDGKAVAIPVIEEYLRIHPQDVSRMLMLGVLLKDIGEYESATDIANGIFEVPQQTVGIRAIEQYQTRPAAAQLLVECIIQQFNVSEEDDRPGLLAQAKEYRKILADYVSNNAESPMLMYADGIIALADGNNQLAAQLLELVINKNPGASAQVFREAAIALENAGSRGLAIERMASAIKKEPGRLSNYRLKAELELLNKDIESAAQTLSVLTPEIREREEVRKLLDFIALNTDSDEMQVADPVLRELKQFDNWLRVNRMDEALALINYLLEQAPQDWRLYAAKSNFYLANDNSEEALDWVVKALELNPDSELLQRRVLLLKSENPLVAYVTYIENQDLTEQEKADILAIHCYELANKQYAVAQRWEQLGQSAKAEEARDLAKLAETESEKYLQKIRELGGNLHSVLLVQFDNALVVNDIEKAKKLFEELEPLLDNEVIEAARVRLNITLAGEARKNSLAEFEAHAANALDGAKNLVELLPFSDSSWRTLAGVYMVLGQSGEALKAYEEAYRIDPANLENVRRYIGLLSIAGKEPQRALRIIRLAREQHSSDEQLRAAWLDIELEFGKKEAVIGFRTVRYQQNPEDRMNALTLAKILVNETPSREYLMDERGRERFTIRLWNQLDQESRKSELDALQNQWDALVNEILAYASLGADESIIMVRTHASIARDRGQITLASEIWDKYLNQLKGTENYSMAVISAADFLQKSSRFEQAIGILKDAISFQSENKEVQSALGSILHAIGRHKEAVEHLEAVARVSSEDTVHARLIESLVLVGQFEKAEAALGQFTTTNDEYAKAMLKAMISRVRSEQMLAQGNIESGTAELIKYRNALRVAIDIDSENAVPYIYLCRSLLNQYRLTQDRALLQEAIDVADEGTGENTDSEDFAVVRTDVLQADGQIHRAIDRLSRFLSENPEANIVRQRLIEAYLDTDEVDKAVSTAQGGIDSDPSDSLWYRRLGELHIRSNDDYTSAVRMYLEALQRNPSVSLLIRIDELTRTEQVLPNRELILMAQGPMAQSHPIIGAIEAKALNNMNRRRDAMLAMTKSWNAFQLALENNWLPPTSTSSWYLNLANLFRDNPIAGEEYLKSLAGDFDSNEIAGVATFYNSYGGEFTTQAIEILNEAIGQEPEGSSQRARLLMMLGGYLVEAKRYKESEIAFTQLSKEQDSPLILNNLAYVVGVYLNKPEEGLVIAKEAAKLAPRVPSILDTVGTLYEYSGQPKKSAETFEFLLQVDPANAKALVKLALLYADPLSDPNRAVVFAERARSQKPRSPEVLDALGWSYYQTGRLAKGEEFLHLSLKRGDTEKAYLHIAQILMSNEKYEEALGQLRIAEELALDDYSRNRISALKDDIRKKQSQNGE